MRVHEVGAPDNPLCRATERGQERRYEQCTQRVGAQVPRDRGAVRDAEVAERVRRDDVDLDAGGA